MNGPAPLLSMRGVSKRYGPTVALDGVSLEAKPGRVVALIGENGAGKSTLMKILAGAERPDAGTMTLAGRPYAPAGPTAARDAGVGMIYQELNLAPDLSVEDNLLLGRERARFGLLDRAEQRRRCRAALAELGRGDLDPRTIVGALPVGTRQVVEIARAVLGAAKVVVFDEPTSSLAKPDADALFAVIRALTARGAAVVYISHFLEEVRAVADDYAVLRDGRAVGAGTLDGVTEAQLVALMVGRSVDELFPQVPHEPGEVLLKIDGLTGAGGVPSGASLEVRRGEILGIAGLVGAGRTELVRAVYGLDAVRSGRVTVGNSPPPAGPRGRVNCGVGFVSEDRAGEGLMPGRSIAENATLGDLGRLSRFGLLNPLRPDRAAAGLIDRLGIKARGPRQAVGELSGGNQQKVAVARVLHQGSDVWLLDEPTRGVDVGAKSDLYRLIGEAAADGKAVVFVSSYLPELLAVCDRVAVMRRGAVVAVRPADEWTEETAMAAAVGGAGEPAVGGAGEPAVAAGIEPTAAAPEDGTATARVVLDSNVVFSGLRSNRGASAVLLRAAVRGNLRVALTFPLLLEYLDVTRRPGANRLPPEEVRKVLASLRDRAAAHEVYYRWPVLPDPADAKVLEAAAVSRAAFLLTYNTRDFPGVVVPGLTVMRPGPFLRLHRPDLLR